MSAGQFADYANVIAQDLVLPVGRHHAAAPQL
jgi:hypothetical protein